MANYKVTVIDTPELEEISSFDSLINPTLSKSELAKLVTLLKPYLDPCLFEDSNSIKFIYYPDHSNELFDDGDAELYNDIEDCYRLIITKE